MKLELLLTLSFLLFAFSTNLLLSFSQGAEQVLDRYGKPLIAARKYYIVPGIFGPTGGGVGLGKTGNSTCPVTLLQDTSEIVKGLPVKFQVPQKSTGFISIGLPLKIASEEKPECATSSNWVAVVDDFPMKWLGIGGARDHPGKKIITGSFNIQAFDASYKLLFCPTMSASPSTCFDIGRHDDVGGRRLVLTKGRPYQVGFIVAS